MSGMAPICNLALMLPPWSHARSICMIPKMRICLLNVSSLNSRPEHTQEHNALCFRQTSVHGFM